MSVKIISATILSGMVFASAVFAQSSSLVGNSMGGYSAQKDAMYLATIKAVADFKINDEENLSDVNKLRQNPRFVNQLQGMLNKLSNSRTKDSKNRQVQKILLQAGKDIYNILD